MGGWPLLFRTPWLMRRYDQLVFLSGRRDFGRFLDHRIARWTGFKNFSIIPNGAFAREFNNDALPDFRGEFNPGSGLLLLCVANYCDRKNQLLAVRAFRRAQLKDATLVLIGGEFNGYSEQVWRLDAALQKELPAGRVVLLEKLSRAQTCAAYRAADLFVLPAKAETQPIVLLEAMASQTPWLSTDTGCVSELPGGIVARSEDDLVEKMRELASSPALRQKLADDGRAACRQTFDWEQVVAAYDRLATKVCGNGQIQN
jgi:glycosyltransferase involved in cell wall biosynthesis